MKLTRVDVASAQLAVIEGEQAARARLVPDVLRLMQTEDAREGLQSFIERRPARFQGQ